MQVRLNLSREMWTNESDTCRNRLPSWNRLDAALNVEGLSAFHRANIGAYWVYESKLAAALTKAMGNAKTPHKIT